MEKQKIKIQKIKENNFLNANKDKILFAIIFAVAFVLSVVINHIPKVGKFLLYTK